MQTQADTRWASRTRQSCLALILIAKLSATAQSTAPEILAIFPPRGPEGTRITISGKNLIAVSSVLFADTPAVFRSASAERLIAIVPHKVTASSITIITPQGRITSPLPFVVVNDPRIPDEVSYKAGYVNPSPPPSNFNSARLWGIAIADTRVPSHESAKVEVTWARLTCRIDGKDAILNDDAAELSGGLYRRYPWFATDEHAPIPLIENMRNHSVVLHVGQRPDRMWHFWSPSSRAALPPGKLEGCTVIARVKISPGALLQMGMDYWRSPTIPYGSGGNNREAGASNWYFPSPEWQEATFTDIGGPQF